MIVLTDIGGDPDDQQSMVRLLLYANEFQLEGLIATALKDHTFHPEMIRERIEAYRQVHPNLTKHADGLPAADDLLRLVKTGCLSRKISLAFCSSTHGTWSPPGRFHAYSFREAMSATSR